MAINRNFVFTDPVAAQQHVALAQLEEQAKEAQNRNIAAMLESQSRERQQRNLSQSQMAQRDREMSQNAQLRREALAVSADDLKLRREAMAANERLRSDKITDAAARERADIQYATVLGTISVMDPPTVRELEAALSANPNLTEDQKNNLRSAREQAAKIAKANAANGERAAANYRLELKGKGMSGKGLSPEEQDKIYKRIEKDKDVFFDRSTGDVISRHRPPREDSSGAGTPTISDMYGMVGKRTRGLLSDAPPTASTIAAPPVSAPVRGPIDLAARMPAGSAGYDAYALMNPRPVAPRVADIAAPPPMIGPPEMLGPPNRPPQASAMDRMLELLPQIPEFSLLPPAGKQMVIDQITGGATNMPAGPPRMSELQTLRPEFIPQDPGYYVAPQ